MNTVNFDELFTVETLFKVLWFVITVAVAYVLYRILKRFVMRFARAKMKPQNAMFLERCIKYAFNILMGLYMLNRLGVNLSALLGAAGIAGIAISFAAQTSISNIISGFFVISERAIQLGDFITVEDVTGTVESIDLLSVKILTLDNQMVRVPNETIIKANLINTTFHPIRRMTIQIGVAYDSDLPQVMSVLFDIASGENLVLKDPAPAVTFDSFADSAVIAVFAVWFKKDDFRAVKNAMMMGIHSRFREEGISIAFPQLDVHVAEAAPENVPDGSAAFSGGAAVPPSVSENGPQT